MKICWAQYLLWFVIAVLGTSAIVSGCGQRGPLTLPDAKQKDKKSEQAIDKKEKNKNSEAEKKQ